MLRFLDEEIYKGPLPKYDIFNKIKMELRLRPLKSIFTKNDFRCDECCPGVRRFKRSRTKRIVLSMLRKVGMNQLDKHDIREKRHPRSSHIE